MVSAYASAPRLWFLILVILSVPLLGQSSKQYVQDVSSALRAKDFNKAIDLSRAGLREFPTDPQLWVLQGAAMVNKGESQNALASFQHALKLFPDYVAALAGAAQIEYQNGNRGAARLLEHLLRFRPLLLLLSVTENSGRPPSLFLLAL